MVDMVVPRKRMREVLASSLDFMMPTGTADGSPSSRADQAEIPLPGG